MSEMEAFLKGGAPKAAAAAPAVETPPIELQAPEPPPKPEPVSDKPAQPRDDVGRFAPKTEDQPPKDPAPAAPKEAPAKSAKPPEVTGLEAGIAAERRSRQEAERRALELEQRFAALEAKLNPPAPPPDPASDPQGYAQTMEQRLQVMEINHKVNTSAAVARLRHQDFDEALGKWNEIIKAEPHLYLQAVQNDDPAEWVYQHVKRQQIMSEIGTDPNAYRARIEAELRQKLEAEYAARAPQNVLTPPAPPPSLAGVRSNGRLSEAVWSGPPTLQSIFKR